MYGTFYLADCLNSTDYSQEPTYEDMTLLSSLLGPAKPPVATSDDVEQAGGVFAFGSPGAPADFNPSESERCLICLSDYEKEAECRQLTKCKHVFHKECIDEVISSICYKVYLLTLSLVVDYGSQLVPSVPWRRC